MGPACGAVYALALLLPDFPRLESVVVAAAVTG